MLVHLMRRLPRRARHNEAGTTLVEVMAAGSVLSVLVICLAGSWTVFDRVSFSLLLRQKAAFVLNGEVERLSSLYATTAFGNDSWTGTNGYTVLPNRPGSDSNHRVYATNSTGVGFATSSLTTFLAPATADTEVLVTGSGTAMQNWVWLDYSRGLVARLSWLECPVTSNMPSACQQQTASLLTIVAPAPPPVLTNTYCFRYDGTSSSGGVCALVTAVLEYPFQVSRVTGTGPALTTVPDTVLSPSSFPASAGAALPPPGLLTLATIVGRRK